MDQFQGSPPASFAAPYNANSLTSAQATTKLSVDSGRRRKVPSHLGGCRCRGVRMSLRPRCRPRERKHAMNRVLGIKGLLLGTGLITALIVTSACSGEKKTEVNVSLSEWSVRPSTAMVKAGSVTFTIKNDGATDHQFVVIYTQRSPDALVVGQEMYDVDEAASGMLIGKFRSFGPGKMESGVFELSRGKYVLICNLPGHYRQGMRAAFSVD